jgi:hypothetical protein
MLVRKIAVIRRLMVRLPRRIDHPVLLHEHDILAEEMAADREHARVRRETQKDVIVSQRTAHGPFVADRRQPFDTEFLSLTNERGVEALAEFGDLGGRESSVNSRVTDQANALGASRNVVAGRGTFENPVIA